MRGLQATDSAIRKLEDSTVILAVREAGAISVVEGIDDFSLQMQHLS